MEYFDTFSYIGATISIMIYLIHIDRDEIVRHHEKRFLSLDHINF